MGNLTAIFGQASSALSGAQGKLQALGAIVSDNVLRATGTVPTSPASPTTAAPASANGAIPGQAGNIAALTGAVSGVFGRLVVVGVVVGALYYLYRKLRK